jgi:hypothetical protein
MERRETYIDIYVNNVHVGTGAFVYTDVSQRVILGATERRVCTSSPVVMNGYVIGNARICFYDNLCLFSAGASEQTVFVKAYVASEGRLHEVGSGYVKVVEEFAECPAVVQHEIVVNAIRQAHEGVVAGVSWLAQALTNASFLAQLIAMIMALRGAKE